MRIRLIALGALAAWLTFCGPKAQGPSVPELNGPTGGVVGWIVRFKVVSVDEQEDTVSYMIDWGDKSQDKWTAFHPSGESLSVAHVYHDSSNFVLRAKSRNGKGGESEWSANHQVQLITTGIGFPGTWGRYPDYEPTNDITDRIAETEDATSRISGLE